MTRRDQFAIAAMQSILSSEMGTGRPVIAGEVARRAATMADSMLEALGEDESPPAPPPTFGNIGPVVVYERVGDVQIMYAGRTLGEVADMIDMHQRDAEQPDRH